MTAEALILCSFSSWLPKYKSHLVGPVEVIKPLPTTFIDYLTSDGILLPKTQGREDQSLQGSDYSDWEEEEEQKEYTDPTTPFKELHNEIVSKISKLGGKFTPKLNWSAPKDSTWILPNNTMKCHTVNDLYLLLNASNYIMHDLSETFTAEIPQPEEFQYELVLRKWVENLNPAMEFRCFVKERILIGISQRDLNYYNYLDSLHSQILDSITIFFERYLQTTFDIDNFIFDVYIPRPFNKCYLIDINPFSRVTDSLLFTWNEITLINGKSSDFEPELRLVDEVNTGRFASKEHSENQVPRDIVDATMDASAMAELAREWKRIMDKEESDSE